jgi:hypothetical protein
MRWIELVGIVGVVAGAAACQASATREGKATGGASTVDSVIPREEALRRFREGVPPVERLEGAESSIETLVAAYVRALETRDTAAVARLAISRAEFAWLYYPTTPHGFPPYDVEPGLMWFLLNSRSDKGARRALSVYGGHQLKVLNQDCGPSGTREGENTIWGPCIVRWVNEGGDTATTRLLGQLIERDHRFKVLSYSNDL